MIFKLIIITIIIIISGSSDFLTDGPLGSEEHFGVSAFIDVIVDEF